MALEQTCWQQAKCGTLSSPQHTIRIKLLDFPPLDLPTGCGRSCSFAAVPSVLSKRLLQVSLGLHAAL